MNKPNRCDRLSWAVKAGAALVVGGCLLVTSPYMNKAQAIDLNAGATNASLVFPPTYLSEPYGSDNPAHAYADVCAWNLTNETVGVIFQMQDLLTGTVVFGFPAQRQILPHGQLCYGTGGPGQSTRLIGASIEFTAPSSCSQAVEYPGKCKVVASLQVYDSFTLAPPAPMNRVQVEPVFVTGSPGRPQIPVTPR